MAAPAIVLLENENRAEFTRWSVAAAIVLAAHVGLVGSYMLWRSDHSQGAPMAPAVIIDLAPMPVAPASPLDVATGPEMLESQPPPEEAVVEPPPPDVIEPPPPEPPPPVETPMVATPEPPPPEPKRVERKKPAPRSERRTAETPAAPSLGSVSSSASIASWRDLVVSQLQRAKRYPSSAEERREQGVVTLSFSLSRSGQVLSRGIARGSGYPELDQEVLAMVQRAQPFPSFPASMPQASMHLSVPIRFTLR